MIKDILVHVDGTKAGARRVSYALNLARRHHAVPSGLHVEANANAPPVYKSSAVERATADLEHRLAEDA